MAILLRRVIFFISIMTFSNIRFRSTVLCAVDFPELVKSLELQLFCLFVSACVNGLVKRSLVVVALWLSISVSGTNIEKTSQNSYFFFNLCFILKKQMNEFGHSCGEV